MTAVPTDEAALLAAVLADTEDDTVRLAYADWLQEHGRDARAEFIRVQIELAGIPNECGNLFCDGKLVVCLSCRRWKYLRTREKYLIHRCLTDDWFPPVGRGESGRVLPQLFRDSFARGFVESVTCTAADWLAHAATILASHPVRRVTLADTEPHQIMPSGAFWWYDTDAGDTPSGANLPDELFFAIPGTTRYGVGEPFPDREAAMNWLSDRCLAWGRRATP